jgi:hypothetical protein
VAGYSGTPLAKKLGIGASMIVATRDAPDHFLSLLDPLPDGVTWKRRVHAPLDVVIAFFRRRGDVSRRWAGLTAAVGPDGVVWVAWPKRSSGVTTDLTEDTFRELLLPSGWVDTKVCAIDDTWSGLKFVLRKELRASAPTRAR